MLMQQAFAHWKTKCRLFENSHGQTHNTRYRYLGLANFHHSFIPHGAIIFQSLYSLLRCTKCPSDPLPWADDTISAFDNVKQDMAHATLLVHPVLNAPTSVMTDASDVTVGAVLQQYLNGQWCPLSFYSRSLTTAVTCYSTYDHELWAIYLSIRHFRYFLEGREFYVLTDHKPLMYALSSHPERHSPRQARHRDSISQFTTLHHVQGAANTVADALSRLEANALHTGTTSVVDFQELALAQADDPELPSCNWTPHCNFKMFPFCPKEPR